MLEELPESIGVLCIKHVASGMYYIARSRNIRHYYSRIISWLKAGKFENKQFQTAFNHNHKLEITRTLAENEYEAIEIQRVRVEELKGKLFNEPTRYGLALGVKPELKTISTPIPITLASATFHIEHFRAKPDASPFEGVTVLPALFKAFNGTEFRGVCTTIKLASGVRIPAGLSALYILSQWQSNWQYIGSTTNLSRRIILHYNTLRNKSHRNHDLQKQVDNSRLSDIEIRFFAFNQALDRMSLQGLEQELIDVISADDAYILLNSSKNAFNPFHERVLTEAGKEGISVSKRKPVMCNGIRFERMLDAAAHMGLPKSSMSRLLNSPSARERGYYYLTENK